jgi:hypothetical protein
MGSCLFSSSRRTYTLDFRSNTSNIAGRLPALYCERIIRCTRVAATRTPGSSSAIFSGCTTRRPRHVPVRFRHSRLALAPWSYYRSPHGRDRRLSLRSGASCATHTSTLRMWSSRAPQPPCVAYVGPARRDGETGAAVAITPPAGASQADELGMKTRCDELWARVGTTRTSARIYGTCRPMR